MTVIRRFIAGASCPACAAVDKLVLLVGSEDQRRECVSCGYSDSLAEDMQVQEPQTRVNRLRPGEAALPHEAEVQVLKLPGDGT
jgi:hypothetical protein